MSRTIYTPAVGKRLARELKHDARETFPDDTQAQKAFMFSEVVQMLEANVGHGKPLPAGFWRAFGGELNS